MIKDYYEKERKYDLMPTIRVMTKSKELEQKRKLLKPLQLKQNIVVPSTMKHKRLNQSVDFNNTNSFSKSKCFISVFWA